jgi:hypothetical protein
MSTSLQVMPNDAAPVTVAPRPQLGLVRPIADPAALLQVQEETRRVITALLVDGRDYGAIPGVDKPSLLKPGAERITIAFGCYSRFRIVEQEIDHDRRVEWQKKRAKWDTVDGRRQKVGEDVTTGVSLGLYRYVVECEIIHRETGLVVGSCLGAASTMESKYIDRPREMENTIAKMAEKRAHVGAVLNAFGLSEQFTQDVEDNPSAYGHGAETHAADVRQQDTHRPTRDDAPVRNSSRAASASTSDTGATNTTSNASARATTKTTTTDAPSCPTCGGKMWDNRLSKRNPKAPDYKCRDRSCDGVIWPPRAGSNSGATAESDDEYMAEYERSGAMNVDDIPF